MYKSIILTSNKFEIYKSDSGNSIVDHLTQINIFVGPNNCGKSTFLRKIFACEDMMYTRKDLDLKKLNFQIEKFTEDVDKILQQNYIADLSGYDPGRFKSYDYLSNNRLTLIKQSINHMKGLCEIAFHGHRNVPNMAINNIDYLKISKEINVLAQNVLKNLEIDEEFVDSIIAEEVKSIYVPTLRGLRGANYENKNYSEYDNYAHRTIDDYFKDAKIVYNGDTGPAKTDDTGPLITVITGPLFKCNYKGLNLMT